MYIKNTTFQGAYGPFFNITNAGLHIFNSVFHLQSHRTSITHLIDFQGFSHDGFPQDGFIFKDALITLTSIDRELLRINIMSVMTSFAKFQNTQIACPIGMNAVETVPLSTKEPNVYHCEAVCTSNMYTFQSGNISLKQTSEWGSKSFVSNHVEPLCNQCPVGAKCSGKVQALPNYWGYRNKDDVVMLRCPTGYCCQDDESCQTFDSCNSNRSGPLCGVCEKGFAESLFDQTCISVEKCDTWFIVLLYISCVVGYGLGLMVINDIKRPITYIVKNIYQCINEKLLNNVKPMHTSKSKNSEKSKSSKKKIKEEGSFKYLQILLYYVQDAALFKIELSGKQSEQTSTFVNILQFTPDVLTVIYDSLTETCFSLGTTTVSKVLFKSLFGPCVMPFLFILYLCQFYVFSVNKKKSKLSSLIKY